MNNINKYEVYKEIKTELEDRKKKQRYFFHEDFVSIEYDAAHQWLYVDWIGYQTEGSIMAGFEKVLEALVHYKTSKILNDNSRVVGIWTPAASWVGSNWFPRIKEAGLKYFAWVYSPSIMSQVSTNETLKNTPFPELIQTFFDVGSARKWLQEKQ